MFDIGWQEIFIIGLLAIIVVGPRDLPRAIKTISMWVKKARGLAREFQSGLDDVTREIELDDLKKSITEGGDFDLAKEIENSIDPTGDMMSDKDFKELENTFYDGGDVFEEKSGDAGEVETDTIETLNPREKALAAVTVDDIDTPAVTDEASPSVDIDEKKTNS